MRPLLPLLLLALPLAAAPVPKATAPKIEDVFGEVSEAKGDCKLEMKKGGGMALTVPSTHPQREPSTAAVVAPLVGKTVEGDFILTVRVSVEVPKAGDTTSVKGVPAVLAGVSVLPSGGANGMGVVFGTVGRVRNGDWTTSRFQCHREPRQSSASEGGNGKGGPDVATWYRVTRRGIELKVETSANGEKWQAFTTSKVNNLTGEVNIGPVAFHNTGQDITATFDEYKIEPLKEEKK